MPSRSQTPMMSSLSAFYTPALDSCDDDGVCFPCPILSGALVVGTETISPIYGHRGVCKTLSPAGGVVEGHWHCIFSLWGLLPGAFLIPVSLAVGWTPVFDRTVLKVGFREVVA
jgi:hypothetical protein